MASAVLASRNDQKWGNPKGLMKNYPPNRINFTQNPSFNFSHNNVENSAYNRDFISFDLASLSKPKLNELKNRLITELRCVRRILNRIEAHEFDSGTVPKHVKKRAREGKRRGVDSAMKKCREVLVKLMNLKSAVPFNQPVDVEALQLPDYNVIIRNPMDLGTIKAKLEKGRYRTIRSFASDVRLTFENAMVYNPKGSKVYVAAEKLSFRFEQLFDPISRSFDGQCGLSKPRGKGLKVGKENVVGLRKREMRIEEKEELVERLVEMPPEVAARMVHILRGRNQGLMVKGDEIELDIEALDVDTLWELQGFVGKYRKVRKMREQEQVENRGSGLDVKKCSPVMVLGPDNVEMNKKGGEIEEDVDIGEEILDGYFPSVEIEKDVAGPNNSGPGSSGSTSDGDSSSSSDSDSSSLSSSDEDGVQSPFVEPANEAQRMDEV